jgi:hypothetical protein
LVGKRFNCGPQIALLRAPPSVQHNNGVTRSSCSAELHDVEIDSITGFQIPVFSPIGKMLSISRKHKTDEKKQGA